MSLWVFTFLSKSVIILVWAFRDFRSRGALLTMHKKLIYRRISKNMAIERKKQKKQSRTVATAAIPMVMLALTRYASTRNYSKIRK